MINIFYSDIYYIWWYLISLKCIIIKHNKIGNVVLFCVILINFVLSCNMFVTFFTIMTIFNNDVTKQIKLFFMSRTGKFYGVCLCQICSDCCVLNIVFKHTIKIKIFNFVHVFYHLDDIF